MSTVLWANALIDGRVFTDESDKHALYKHARKLDKISRRLKLAGFLSAHDFTDLQFNLSEEDLPEGMDSTDQVMAESGIWLDGDSAVEMIEGLIAHIVDNNVKFGWLGNDAEAIVFELGESLKVAIKARDAGGKFNFSVVM